MSDRSAGAATADYRDRYNHAKEADAEKDALISEMINEFERLRSQGRQLIYDLESEKNERRRLQERVELLSHDLTALTNRRSFVVMLLDADADAYVFQERYLNKDDKGGKEAADQVVIGVKAEMQNLGLDVDNTDIVVRAYANIKGLTKALRRDRKMRETADLASFARGFTQRQGLFDFVDVGSGKEEADEKIRESLRFYVGDVQCKHVFLGVCHDSGYASFLNKFAADSSTSERITLLQSGRIVPNVAALGFRKTEVFKSVFCQPVIIPDRPSSRSVTAAVQGPPFINAAIRSERLGPVLRDEEGRRVDKQLDVDPNARYVQVLRNSNLCRWYYLRGECAGCDRVHTVQPLNTHEYDCLWLVARQGPCFKIRKGKDCDDPKCIYGHQQQV